MLYSHRPTLRSDLQKFEIASFRLRGYMSHKSVKLTKPVNMFFNVLYCLDNAFVSLVSCSLQIVHLGLWGGGVAP